MRLYEFTNPSHYLLPEAHAADLLKQAENIKTADTTAEVVGRLRKKSETKMSTKML